MSARDWTSLFSFVLMLTLLVGCREGIAPEQAFEFHGFRSDMTAEEIRGKGSQLSHFEEFATTGEAATVEGLSFHFIRDEGQKLNVSYVKLPSGETLLMEFSTEIKGAISFGDALSDVLDRYKSFGEPLVKKDRYYWNSFSAEEATIVYGCPKCKQERNNCRAPERREDFLKTDYRLCVTLRYNYGLFNNLRGVWWSPSAAEKLEALRQANRPRMKL